MDATALTVFVVLLAIVTIIGFVAVRWRRAAAMNTLDQWGLGGRPFGGFGTGCLLGGDLYTAYTFIAVPGAMYAAGAVSGWFAVAYTILVWPIVFVLMARLCSVSHKHGFATPADFVFARFDSRWLALAVAFTGILALMPYIALQLVGIQSVLEVMGVGAGASTIAKDLPLIIAFLLLAAYTYVSGLRAPALIAFVKDFLVYLVVIVAVIYIPIRLGGYGTLFHAVFPSWFAGVAYAAVAIGALVPAAIMSIAAANLFTRNIYRAWFRPAASDAEEARVSKIASLVVKFGALAFVLTLNTQNA